MSTVNMASKAAIARIEEQIYEIKRLRGCILGLYRELGKKHKDVCFDPDCDGTCCLDKHPFEWEKEP